MTTCVFFMLFRRPHTLLFFFFNDTATTEIYTLSLHDALPILTSVADATNGGLNVVNPTTTVVLNLKPAKDRKSTRLNSSHQIISYAVFCLKKKKKSFLRWLEKLRSVHLPIDCKLSRRRLNSFA